jgi:hypothetical protein
MIFPFEQQQTEAEKRIASARKNIFKRIFSLKNNKNES